MPKKLTFLQFSDLHLDSPLMATALSYTEHSAALRNKEIREVFTALIKRADREQVDGVLVGGDMWHEEIVSPETVSFVIETCRAVPHIPMYIIPGNHDFYSCACPYSSEYFLLRDIGDGWPENVVVYKDSSFSTETRQINGVSVGFTGCAYSFGFDLSVRPLARPIARPDTDVSILLFHGSREAVFSSQLEGYYFDNKELLSQGFDYTALSHYHNWDELRDGKARLKALYTGTPAVRVLAEEGQRHCALIHLTVSGGSVIAIEADKIPTDTRKLVRVRADMTGLTNTETAAAAVVKLAGKAGFKEGTDLLYADLCGRLSSRLDLDGISALLSERSFCHGIGTGDALPEYDLENVMAKGRDTVEGRFVKALYGKYVNAEGPEKQRYLHAIRYGLDSLSGKKVVPCED